MSYCSWAKKNSSDRESIGDSFYGATLYYRDFYAFSSIIGDALNGYGLRGENHYRKIPKVLELL